jgi:hypothetical protein
MPRGNLGRDLCDDDRDPLISGTGFPEKVYTDFSVQVSIRVNL